MCSPGANLARDRATGESRCGDSPRAVATPQPARREEPRLADARPIGSICAPGSRSRRATERRPQSTSRAGCIRPQSAPSGAWDKTGAYSSALILSSTWCPPKVVDTIGDNADAEDGFTGRLQRACQGRLKINVAQHLNAYGRLRSLW